MQFTITKIEHLHDEQFAPEIELPDMQKPHDGYLLSVKLRYTPRSDIASIIVTSGYNNLLRHELTPEEKKQFVVDFMINLTGTGEYPKIIIDFSGRKGRLGRTILICQRKKLDIHLPDLLRPILVNGLFRSGTTLLMRLLAQSPSVTCHKVYPYEYRFAYYWIHLFRILSSGYQQPFDNWHFQTKSDAITAFPYYPFLPEMRQWFQTEHVNALVRYVQSAINSAYRSHPPAGATHFLEKFPGHYVGLFQELFPDTREIIILRDFRDVFMSVKLFNAKRGYVAFGRENHSSDESYLRHLAALFERMLRRGTASGNTVLLLRYEDLIQNEQQELSRVCEWAGVAYPENISPDDASASRHMTSETQQASIGKWRNTREQDLVSRIAREYEHLLSQGGYAL